MNNINDCQITKEGKKLVIEVVYNKFVAIFLGLIYTAR
jgi:hypothetical protein